MPSTQSKRPRSSGRHHDDNILCGRAPHSTALLEHRVQCAERGNAPATQGYTRPCRLLHKDTHAHVTVAAITESAPRARASCTPKARRKEFLCNDWKGCEWNSCHHKLRRDPLLTPGVGFWTNQSHMKQPGGQSCLVSGEKRVLKHCVL